MSQVDAQDRNANVNAPLGDAMVRNMLIITVTLCVACSDGRSVTSDVSDASSDGWTIDSGTTDVDTSDSAASDRRDSDDDVGPPVECGTPTDRLNGQRGVESANLEDCDVFLGSIDFAYSPINDLKWLSSLRAIGATLNIFHNEELSSLEGLERLERVGELNVRLSYQLEDLSELSRLREVEGRLLIDVNESLTSLRGLEQLRVVGALQIDSNFKLESLAGLDGLERVRGDLRITNNDLLHPAEIQRLLDRIQVDGETTID